MATDAWKMAAYAAVKDRFDLKAGQRDQLDASPLRRDILQYAHYGQWDVVERLLIAEGITQTEENHAEPVAQED